MIDHCSSTPKYIQLSELLEYAIKNGDYKDGEKLPSENQLCNEYGVSRMTVRQSLAKLEQKNLVYSVHGKGTFVILPTISQGLMKITSFEKTLEQKGLKGHTSVQSYGKSGIPIHIKRFFDIDEIYCLRLVGYGNKMPLVYYNSYLPEELGNKMHEHSLKMQAENKAFSTLDIYPHLSINSVEINQKLTAVVADEKISKILEIKEGMPVFSIETFAYDENNTLLEYKVAYYRSDKYSFTIKRQL